MVGGWAGGAEPASNLLSPADRPVVAELAASPPGGVRPGGNFTLTCRAEAWPPAQISWRAPPGALNIGLSSNNSTLSVAGALGSHGGEYECAATNAHGRHARRITVRVAGKWQLGAGRGSCRGRDLRLGARDPSLPPAQSPQTSLKGARGEARGALTGGAVDGGLGWEAEGADSLRRRDPPGLGQLWEGTVNWGAVLPGGGVIQFTLHCVSMEKGGWRGSKVSGWGVEAPN